MQPGARVVLTKAQYEHAFELDHFDVLPLEVPAEDDDYCDERAHDILGRFVPRAIARNAHLRNLLHLIAESGIIGVNLPISLLANYFQVKPGDVVGWFKKAPFPQLVHLVGEGDSLSITFKGEWLAQYLVTQNSDLPLLLSLLDYLLISNAEHRCFLLNLMVALRVKGNFAQFHQLQREYLPLLGAIRKRISKNERQAWHLLSKSVFTKLHRFFLRILEIKLGSVVWNRLRMQLRMKATK